MYNSRMVSSASALVAIILVASGTLAVEFSPNDAPSGKQSPLGFGNQPAKSLTSPENENFVKRAPMGFQGMRGKKDIVDNALSDIEDFEKRAPMGFHGMRGKKDYLTSDIGESDFFDEYLKRAPMGFQGMRGKKALGEEDYYKRAAMGFQGMRGKKSLDLIPDDFTRYGENGAKFANLFDYPEEFEKRAPAMGFQGMRGKRDEFEDEWSKRAPMGFQGMRGKKSFLAEINDLEKRAMMGFQGMRGKKSTSGLDYHGYRSVRSVGAAKAMNKPKRLNLGFIASRGKRSDLTMPNAYSKISAYELQDALADELAEDLYLRDALAYRADPLPLQFNKRSAYGYSAVARGKKVPGWEIRGKFIGVRGKRNAGPKYVRDAGISSNNVLSNNERIGVAGSTTNSDIQ